VPEYFDDVHIAEAKSLHGLSSTRYRGLERVAIQGLMTASVQNIKRLLAMYRKERPENVQILRKILDILSTLKPGMNIALAGAC
jgi:hypothetical protein